MNIQQVQEFRLFDRRDEKQLVIVRLHRISWGAFENCFRMEKTTQDGKAIAAKPVTEEFAKTVLDYALICLPKQDIEITRLSREPVSEEFAQIVLDQALFSLPKQDIEITRLSTGTDFNYPIPHV